MFIQFASDKYPPTKSLKELKKGRSSKGTISRVLCSSLSRLFYLQAVGGIGWNDGHLSRTLIVQGLKRPHPSRLSPMQLHKGNLNGLFSSPAYCGGSGTYLVLLRVGFTYLPRSLRVLVSSYLTFSPLLREMAATPISRSGIFSVALSLPCGIRVWLISQG